MLELFETALKKLDSAGRKKFGDEWPVRLAKRREKLKQAYASLDETDRDAIQYSSLSARTAYVFAYAPTRAIYTREFLMRHRLATGTAYFGKPEICVVSFGGGPGSELVGLVDYLKNVTDEGVLHIRYLVYDKDGDWESVANDVASSLETDFQIVIEYHKTDVVDAQKMNGIDLSSVDMVIFSYFMSEIAKLEARDVAVTNFRSTLATLNVGAKILFIDNKHPIFIDYFRSCKSVTGLLQKNDNGDSVDVNLPELVGTFASISKLLDWSPRTELNSVSKLIVRT